MTYFLLVADLHPTAESEHCSLAVTSYNASTSEPEHSPVRAADSGGYLTCRIWVGARVGEARRKFSGVAKFGSKSYSNLRSSSGSEVGARRSAVGARRRGSGPGIYISLRGRITGVWSPGANLMSNRLNYPVTRNEVSVVRIG